MTARIQAVTTLTDNGSVQRFGVSITCTHMRAADGSDVGDGREGLFKVARYSFSPGVKNEPLTRKHHTHTTKTTAVAKFV